MLLIVLVITIALFFINLISEKKNLSQTLGGSFYLKDHTGGFLNSKKLNKKKLIYFGYTFCPDICPMDMLRISQLYDKNPSLEKKLVPIFITVDPLRDDQKALKSFIENFNVAFIGLTGSEIEIKKVIKDYKIYVSYNKKNEDDQEYLVDHSSLIFLLDENDQFLTLLRPNELSIDKIKQYLKEVI